MAEHILNTPDETAIDEIVKYLSQYPTNLLEKAADHSISNHTPFIRKKIYDIKEKKELELFHPFWVADENRFSLFPIQHWPCWESYNVQKAMFWTAGDITFTKDRFEDLSPIKKRIVKFIMGYFSVADAVVDENLLINIIPKLPAQEARYMYMYQMMMENIHGEVYGRMIDEYITDPVEKKVMFSATQNMHSVQMKIDWTKKWMNESMGIAQNLAAFAIVESQMFPVLFALIFWLRSNKEPLEGFFHSNDLISRDEGKHGEAGAMMYNTYIPPHLRLSQETFVQMTSEGVLVDIEFIKEALEPQKTDGDEEVLTFGGEHVKGSSSAIDTYTPGLSVKSMTTYIKFLADQNTLMMGYEPIYRDTNPFPFMENLGLGGKTDFFSKRVPDYRRDTVSGESSCVFEIIDDL